MDNPKISVLIPMYNRKHYIQQCLDSALNQTFKEEYEIVVRDDGSTDGSYDFVAEKYAKQISDGKIRLLRNNKNLGETKTTIALFHDAAGKYVAVLHSDDLFLPHALQHLYEVAEKTNADVVHESVCLNSKKDGIIDDIKDCSPYIMEKNIFKEVTIMPNDPISRFREWFDWGTFIDIQYNLFQKDFVLENVDFIEGGVALYYSLWWIMTAKIFIKTPVICYVRRDSSDSLTNEKYTIEKIVKAALRNIELLNEMDKIFPKIDFFKNNEYFQYMAKAHLISVLENFNIDRHGVYVNGITPENYDMVADMFKKYFGHDYFYPMYFFNFARVAPFNYRVDVINFAPPPPRFSIAA